MTMMVRWDKGEGCDEAAALMLPLAAVSMWLRPTAAWGLLGWVGGWVGDVNDRHEESACG